MRRVCPDSKHNDSVAVCERWQLGFFQSWERELVKSNANVRKIQDIPSWYEMCEKDNGRMDWNTFYNTMHIH